MADNHWFTETCARAFWDQKEGAPYKQLVADTIDRAAPRGGERWLDLGCGSGQLSAALWQASQGSLEELVCLDCAPINADPVRQLQERLAPGSQGQLFRFIARDFSNGLPSEFHGQFDGVISGLSISYAEHRDPKTGEYTQQAFRHLLADVRRVLRPGGRFVFSINVPNPRFEKILWATLGKGLRISKPGRQLASALRMMWYGRWLKQEARKGRFHYLPIDELTRCLQEAGFAAVEHKLTYAGQAFVIRALPEVIGQRQSA